MPQNGDSVTVAEGTYVGSVVFSTNHNNKVIKLVGQGRESTTIDGNSSKHVVDINSEVYPKLRMSGFTIKNGHANGGPSWLDSYGGGICSRGGQNNFEDLIIKDNSASSGGGGIFCFGSTDTLRNIIFSNNTGSSVTAWNQIYVENCLFESENDPSYALDLAGGSGQSTNHECHHRQLRLWYHYTR